VRPVGLPGLKVMWPGWGKKHTLPPARRPPLQNPKRKGQRSTAKKG